MVIIGAADFLGISACFYPFSQMQVTPLASWYIVGQQYHILKILSVIVCAPLCALVAPSCISRMRYSASFPFTQRKRGLKYPLFYNIPLSTSKDGALTLNILASFLSKGNLPSVTYSIFSFPNYLCMLLLTLLASLLFLFLVLFRPTLSWINK